MKVSELIAKLSQMDPERIVVISSDEEGNSYREMWSISDDYSYRDRDIGLEKLSEKDKKQGYTEEDLMDGGKPAVVFW